MNSEIIQEIFNGIDRVLVGLIVCYLAKRVIYVFSENLRDKTPKA